MNLINLKWGMPVDKFNQLIAKAISTTSDDEALACLRMAKKIGGEVQISVGEYNGKTAEYWYDKAKKLYDNNKSYESSYEKVVRAGYRLSSERDVLQKQVREQASIIGKQKMKIIFLSMVSTALVLGMATLIVA